MEAYIEFVILDNFAVDCMILIIVLHIERLKVIKIRLLSACFVGTAGAVIMPLIPFLAAIFLRIFLAPLMIIILSKYKTLKQYFLTLFLMVLVTFAIGGAIIGIFNMSVLNNMIIFNYPSNGIIGLSAFCIILIFYVLKQLSNSMRIRTNNKELMKVKLIKGEDNINCTAYYDSGNILYDNNMKPVIVIDKAMEGRIEKLFNSGETINVNTINGNNKTRTYIIEKVVIYNNGQVNTIYNVSLVISNTSFNNYDLLLHKEMI